MKPSCLSNAKKTWILVVASVGNILLTLDQIQSSYEFAKTERNEMEIRWFAPTKGLTLSFLQTKHQLNKYR